MRAAMAGALLAALACERRAPAPPPPPLPRPAPFIAFERDFQGFRAWERIELPDRPAEGITHVAGRRREYVNGRPPAGSASFPVGTMLVKEMLTTGEEGHKLFAMVKRGGGYNARGAPGWEWFELRERGDGSVAIVWRGINAPSGESYAGDPLGGCNGCHEIAAGNDFVRAKALALAATGGARP